MKERQKKKHGNNKNDSACGESSAAPARPLPEVDNESKVSYSIQLSPPQNQPHSILKKKTTYQTVVLNNLKNMKKPILFQSPISAQT